MLVELNEKKGARTVPRRGLLGLYHFAILLPSRVELARTLKRVLDHGWPIAGAADHGVSEAIYFADPDGNGIEIYRDRPRDEWPRQADGEIAMVNAPLDFDGLLAELAREGTAAGAQP